MSKTITTEQIKTLRDESLAAGDEGMAWTCENALNPTEDGYANGETMVTWSGKPTTRTDARALCARAIASAEANS